MFLLLSALLSAAFLAGLWFSTGSEPGSIAVGRFEFTGTGPLAAFTPLILAYAAAQAVFGWGLATKKPWAHSRTSIGIVVCLLVMELVRLF